MSSARKIDILKVAYCRRLSRPRDYLNRVYNIKSESRVGGGGGREGSVARMSCFPYSALRLIASNPNLWISSLAADLFAKHHRLMIKECLSYFVFLSYEFQLLSFRTLLNSVSPFTNAIFRKQRRKSSFSWLVIYLKFLQWCWPDAKFVIGPRTFLILGRTHSFRWFLEPDTHKTVMNPHAPSILKQLPTVFTLRATG